MHDIWAGLLLIAVYGAILVYLLGIAALCGILLMVLAVPVTAISSRRLAAAVV